MPFISGDDHRPRRNARSLDLDDSATKAAAWVWHLHTSKPGVSTEGRFISSQIRRGSSGNFDRKATRFRQEASTTRNRGGSGSERDASLWDCGSNLYDTFELVDFGKRLDQSLMEVVPMTPLQAGCQEHHMKSLLHKPSGILRTCSLPRRLSQQPCKKHYTAVASPSPSPSQSKFKISKSEKHGARASSFTSSYQKASTRWSRVGKFINAMKKVVILHKQVSFLGCKRSIKIIESSQRPLDSISEIEDDVCARGTQLLVNENVRANLSTSNLTEGECMGDEFPKFLTKLRNSTGGTRRNYKLSIPMKDKSTYQSDRFDLALMQKKVEEYSRSESFGSGLSTSTTRSAKMRSYSDSMRDEIVSEHKRIKPRRTYAGDDIVFLDDRIKGSNLGVDNVKERSGVANENVDYYKHLHHHHHHHHHHHNLASESARLSPETMLRICAEQSWLI